MPNSLAMCAIGLPLVCANRTASRFNSSVEVRCTFFILVHPLSEGVYLKGFPPPRFQGKFSLFEGTCGKGVLCMPVEFLIAEQRQRYGCYVEEPYPG